MVFRYDLNPNGTQTDVPGTGSSVTLQYGELVIDAGTPDDENFQYLDVSFGGPHVITCFVNWPASSSGLRGQSVEYSTDGGTTWHTALTESHSSNTNTNAGTASGTFEVLGSSTIRYRVRVYQNSGSTVHLTGSWVKFRAI